MVKHASDNGIYTITSTNAHYLDEAKARATVESGLDKIVISVDGVTDDTYKKYRIGGDLNKVIAGTKEIILQKRLAKSRSPHIVWQFVVFRHNEHEVKLVKKLGRELGVDEVKIKTAQVYDFENGSELIPEAAEYSRYEKAENGKLKIRNKLLDQCWRMWQGCVITWDGKLVPCCFDKDAKHQVGDLQTQSLKEIWFSEPYNAFRRSVLTGRDKIDICNNCTEGTKVFA
jgi:radical SAM protein with 4Fe4S-binding SPASM domain